MGDVQQTTGTDPIGAFLVFLHLLESKAERLAKRRLTYAERAPTRPHAARDVLVSRAGAPLVHLITLIIGRRTTLQMQHSSEAWSRASATLQLDDNHNDGHPQRQGDSNPRVWAPWRM